MNNSDNINDGEELKVLKPIKNLERIKPENEKCENFEQILELVGSEGKYQKTILYFVYCPIYALAPLILFSGIFLWDIPDHWCHVPGREANVSLEEWRNLTIPKERGPDGVTRYSQCKIIDSQTGNESQCKTRWEYDTSEYASTIPSDFNWVCDKDHYATECRAWGGVGGAIGTIIFGMIADKIGRKPVYITCSVVFLLLASTSLFLVNNFILYKSLILLSASVCAQIYTMPSQILLELCGPDYRSWVFAIGWMIWVVGNALLPFVAMISREWFTFGVATLAPGIIFLICYPLIDESPRWLITVGRRNEAVDIILKIGKRNKKSIERSEVERMVSEIEAGQRAEAKGKSKVGVWTLFSTIRLAKNTLMLIIVLTINDMLYYGITLNTTQMSGDKFMNYFYLAMIELPGGWIAGKLVELTGRRWTQAVFFLICTFSLVVCAVAVVEPGMGLVVIFGALGIKLALSVTSMIAYLQAAEIFPTELRSTGSGLAFTVSAFFGILTPYIIYSGTVNAATPYIILSACSFVGIICSSCLPETFKQNLPETIEDANKFGKDHKFWSYLPKTIKDNGGEVRK